MSRRLWQFLSSPRTLAVSAAAVAGLFLVSLLVPQGRAAREILALHDHPGLAQLAAWGLTDVFQSAWFHLVLFVFAAVLSAVWLESYRQSQKSLPLEPPDGVPLQKTLRVPLPEAAPEQLPRILGRFLGLHHLRTHIDGHRVTEGFGYHLQNWRPFLGPLGLVILAVGMGRVSEDRSQTPGAPYARVEVTNPRTNTIGHFDLVEGEAFEFFGFPGKYILRNYHPSYLGQGPAVRIERQDPKTGQSIDFWVFQRANTGFDRFHRKGSVGIELLAAGRRPKPGQGSSPSAWSLLPLIGMGLLVFAATQSGSSKGLLWVKSDGHEVELLGVPLAAPEAFQGAFDQWAEAVTAYAAELEELA